MTRFSLSKLAKKVGLILAGTFIAMLLAALVVLIWLVVPTAPSRSAVVDFRGFIELPGARGLNVLDYLTLKNHRIFVTGESEGTIYRVDLAPDQPINGASVTAKAGPPSAHGVALVPGSRIAFVSRSDVNTVDAINIDTLAVIKRIPVAEDADGILYDPETHLIYVVHGDARLATLIDPVQMQPVGIIPLGGKPEFQQLDPATHLLYQNLADTDQLVAVDLKQRLVMARWELPGCERPSGMAIDASTRRLFVLCSGNARLAIFNLETHHVVSTLPVGSGPDAVAFDPELHRLYVAGKGGFLTIIKQNGPDDYAVLDDVRTHYGAHTLALDPATHAIYVGYASLFAAPRLAVFLPHI